MADLTDTVRLAIRYDGVEANILSATLIRSVDPSGLLSVPEGASGTWVSLLNAQGREVLRRALPDAGTADEMGSPDGGMSRAGDGSARTAMLELPWPGEGASIIVHVGGSAELEGTQLQMALIPQRRAMLESLSQPLQVRPIWGADSATALTLLFLPDGFLATEMDAFHAAIDRCVGLFATTQPFARMTSALRVAYVDMPSATSGITGTSPGATIFSGHFEQGLDRVILIDQSKALSVMNNYVQGSGVAMVVANTAQYGGSGGAAMALSCHASSPEIALHELGHSAFGLADEYADAGQSATDEPIEPNVCAYGDRARIKWADLILPTTPLPTLSAGATVLDPPPAGVGAFEGAKYHAQGRYRPQFDCKMRTLGQPFCAVCTRAISTVLARHAT